MGHSTPGGPRFLSPTKDSKFLLQECHLLHGQKSVLIVSGFTDVREAESHSMQPNLQCFNSTVIISVQCLPFSYIAKHGDWKPSGCKWWQSLKPRNMETKLRVWGAMTELHFQKHGLQLGYLDLDRKAQGLHRTVRIWVVHGCEEAHAWYFYHFKSSSSSTCTFTNTYVCFDHTVYSFWKEFTPVDKSD